MWVLDGDEGHSNLLKFALNAKNYAHTLVILTVSMTTPWSWQDQLEHWMKLLIEHINSLKIETGKLLDFQLPLHHGMHYNVSIQPIADVRKKAEQRLVALWQNYCEPGDEMESSALNKPALRLSSIDEEEVLPLPDEVLTRNVGLDIIVVVTKVSAARRSTFEIETKRTKHAISDRLYVNTRKGIQLSRRVFRFHATMDSAVLSPSRSIVVLHKRERR